MQPLRRINYALCLVLCLTLALGPKTCAANSTPGLLLTQVGDAIGQRRLYLTPHALRIDSIKGGYILVCHSPDWNVTIYNLRSKKFFETPLQKFQGELTGKLWSGDKKALSAGQWNKIKGDLVCGQATTRFKMTPTAKSMAQGNRINLAFYSVLTEPSLPQQAFDVIRLVYQLPSIKGIPVELSFFDVDDNKVNKQVHTSRIEKVSLQDNQFAAPIGLIETKNRMEVFVDPLSQQAYDGFNAWTDPDIRLPKTVRKK